MDSIETLVDEIRSGRMVVLVDDEDRENEGDLVLAADCVTPEAINFMAKEARGLICLSLSGSQADRLQLPLMVRDETNLTKNKTAFTVSIEASQGVTTGISTADRAHTIRVASRLDAKPSDIVTPGHVFPIRAQEGGVLRRAGHTEGSVDLAKLAGCSSAAVICEVMNEDGTMARLPQLKEFAQKHGLKIGSIVDLIRYRLKNDTLVSEVARSVLPTATGLGFEVRVYRNNVDGTEHVVLKKGEVGGAQPTLVRVHSECMTGDVFGSLRCDCGAQLKSALQLIEKEGRGVLLYLRQEGRGIGLVNKVKAYALQDQGMDTVEANLHLGFRADQRDYGIGAQILRALGIHKIRLMTNNPSKRVGLKGYGLEIVDRIPLEVAANPTNRSYMEVKKEKLGHILNLISSEDKKSGE